jgi:carboxyl-terminal processing protease
MIHVVLDGAPGTRVRLTVERSGTAQGPEEVILERSSQTAADVTVDEVAPGISRIRLASLADDTGTALARAWHSLGAPGTDAPVIRGVVLDLRSTAAASTEGARAVADAFLQSGPVVRTISRHDGQERQQSAAPGDLADGRPLVVLVDGGTSGTAEMLASALKEARRARIVGTKTAGRGALRTLIGLDRNGHKGLLRLTTERLVTPAGLPIEGKGVTPDITIEQLPAVARCRARDIEEAPGRCVPRSLAEDTQLQRAISILDEPLVAAKQGADLAKP